MSKKNIYYVSTIILISTIFGCKNNQIAEKVADISFLKDLKIENCHNRNNPKSQKCKIFFNFKENKISLEFRRNYTPNKFILDEFMFSNDPEANNKIFYQNELVNINSLKYSKEALSFNDFNNFIANFTIDYSNDSIKIEFIENKKEIIHSALSNFFKKSIALTVNNEEINQTLTNDLNYLNTIAPTDFNYEKLKKLQFISVDLDSLEKLLLEIIRNHKDEMIPSDD